MFVAFLEGHAKFQARERERESKKCRKEKSKAMSVKKWRAQLLNCTKQIKFAKLMVKQMLVIFDPLMILPGLRGLCINII